MNTQFSQPPQALRQSLQSFWQTEGTPGHKTEYILPKGSIEIIFNFGSPIPFHRDEQTKGLTPRCFINGASSRKVELCMPPYQHFFGVVLQPAAVRKLFSAPSGIFHNAITDLELVNPVCNALWHELAAAPSFEERQAIVTAWTLKKEATFHAREMAISSFLHTKEALTSVTAMAAAFCYSTRQLHRKTHELFGMSTEHLLRFKRYQSALHAMHATQASLTHIAYDCGYFDQAHFTHEFRSYTGLTPSTYRRQKSHLPGHLFLDGDGD